MLLCKLYFSCLYCYVNMFCIFDSDLLYCIFRFVWLILSFVFVKLQTYCFVYILHFVFRDSGWDIVYCLISQFELPGYIPHSSIWRPHSTFSTRNFPDKFVNIVYLNMRNSYFRLYISEIYPLPPWYCIILYNIYSIYTLH